jgi:hypothetical protein
MLIPWALSLGLLLAKPPWPSPLAAPSWGGGSEPRVSVWTDRADPYRRGDAVRVFASTRVDGYLTLFRIDTDGELRVLFPREPWADAWMRGGRVIELDDAPGHSAFLVDDYPGVGYLFAITSQEPFDYSDIVRRDQWDYREMANGRVHSDPYVALTRLADRISPNAPYDYDVTPYYVERRYAYPRFVCYDCHSYAPYAGWNPYGSSCKRYRIVIYDDPYYYPYQAYGGRAVVPGRPARLEPRYVFEDADGRSPWVTRTQRSQARQVEASSPYRDRPAEGERSAVPVPRRAGDQAPAPRRRDPAPSLAPVAPRTTGEPELRRRKPDSKGPVSSSGRQ